MFVHRWGILRKAIPANIGMKRTTALVMCLSRLHNFCIDSRLASSTADLESVPEVPPALSSDEDKISIAGGMNHARRSRLHLKYCSTVVSTLMMSTVGTFVQLKEKQLQEMLFFRATSFMIWWSRRISFVQHLLLGGTNLQEFKSCIQRIPVPIVSMVQDQMP